ncbi:MAG: phosphohydrolase [Pseudoflavonifractor sp.]|nr:phosphohydrolase [Pseudoflavonifractor sp.]
MFWKLNEKAPWISCISDLLADEAVQSMRALPQHRPGFSCYHHSLLVSYASYCLCRRLGWHAGEAARGALLHDFYLYDWTDRRLHTCWSHLRCHGETALKNAEERFLLTRREKDVIVTHMFPLTPTPCRFRESFAVSFIDKVCAVLELIGLLPEGLDVPYALPAAIHSLPFSRAIG